MSTAFKVHPRSYTATAIEFDGTNGKEVREFLKEAGFKVRGTNKWVKFYNRSQTYEYSLSVEEIVILFPNHDSRDGDFAVYPNAVEFLKHFRVRKSK